MINPLFESAHEVIHRSLQATHQARFRVTGKSMQPIIQKGDWIVIEPIVNPEMLSIGDIVLFSRENEFVVHRLIGWRDGKMIAQGDWAKIVDLPILKCKVIGKVIKVEKKKLRIHLNHPLVNQINLLMYQVLKNIKALLTKKRRKK